MSLEIERKYRVSDAWDIPPKCVGTHMRQAYLSPLGADTEVRVRGTAEGYVMTVKTPRRAELSRAHVRGEVEFPIQGDVFEELWAVALDRIEKTRFLLSVDTPETTASVDVYQDSLQGLRVVEVEFSDLEEAEAFEPPVWFAEELTGEPEWGNRALAAAAAESGVKRT